MDEVIKELENLLPEIETKIEFREKMYTENSNRFLLDGKRDTRNNALMYKGEIKGLEVMKELITARLTSLEQKDEEEDTYS